MGHWGGGGGEGPGRVGAGGDDERISRRGALLGN